ncbi:MAG: hypothetical protein ACK5TN_01325 [Acidobacteriota bacterium]
MTTANEVESARTYFTINSRSRMVWRKASSDTGSGAKELSKTMLIQVRWGQRLFG